MFLTSALTKLDYPANPIIPGTISAGFKHLQINLLSFDDVGTAYSFCVTTDQHYLLNTYDMIYFIQNIVTV